MRAKNIIAFLLIAAVIFMACYVCVFDVTIGDYRFPDALDEEYGIKQGLDLVGGSLIEFKAEEGVIPTSEQMETVTSIMRNRLDSQSYFDPPEKRRSFRRQCRGGSFPQGGSHPEGGSLPA